LSYCPRSSLSADVLAWLTTRLAHLAPRPSGRGGTPPVPLEVRLDAVGAVLLDGLSYQRAGRMVGICKSEVGDRLDLLLGELVALGLCQPDGTFVTSLGPALRVAGLVRCRSAFIPGYFNPGRSPATCVTCALHSACALVVRGYLE
jgi:hypothetical protein